MESQFAILLKDYNSRVESADRLDKANLRPVMFGLFGEVGSILATAKKGYREKGVFAGYRQSIEEEFGDTLWYFAALCRRLGVGVDEVFGRVLTAHAQPLLVAATDLDSGPIAGVAISNKSNREDSLVELGRVMCDLMVVSDGGDKAQAALVAFAVQ